MRIVSVINYKGGVGKTTLTANLGAELARRGKRVLLVDLDPQASLTYSFFSPDKAPAGRDLKAWFDTFVEGIPQRNLGDFVSAPPEVNTRIHGEGGYVGLIPSNLRLIDIDLHLLTNAGMGKLPPDVEVYRLRRALADALRYPGLAQYDFVLIDCPPNFNIVTQGAIVASDYFLVPARPDYLSTLGISSLLGAVETFVSTYNNQVLAYSSNAQSNLISPTPLGVVFTMVRYRSPQPVADHQYYMDYVRRSVHDVPAFTASVRENVAFGGRDEGKELPIILRSSMTHPYYVELMALATEFLDHFKGNQNKKAAVA
jgi:chromosome partitioning protein